MAEGGVEAGIRLALLSNPQFVFRLEPVPASTLPGEVYAIDDFALASRLSYFLWGAPPDDELLTLAADGSLHQVDVLLEQAQRMLREPEPEAESLASRFGAQWLQLAKLEPMLPDVLMFPDYDRSLNLAMRRETELLF